MTATLSMVRAQIRPSNANSRAESTIRSSTSSTERAAWAVRRCVRRSHREGRAASSTPETAKSNEAAPRTNAEQRRGGPRRGSLSSTVRPIY